ncbi:hypothetical protein GCM10010837_10250 [Aminobacter niigataensis]
MAIAIHGADQVNALAMRVLLWGAARAEANGYDTKLAEGGAGGVTEVVFTRLRIICLDGGS